MTKDTFNMHWFGLCEIKGQSPSEFVTNAYYNALKHLTDDQFIFAINWAINDYQFNNLPQIAQLKALFEADRDAKITAEAYKVIAEIRRVGSYGNPRFDNSATAEAVKMIGWNKLCTTMTDDKIGWFLKEFSDVYDVAEKHEIKQVATNNLPKINFRDWGKG